MNPIAVLHFGQHTIDDLIARLRPDDWQAIALDEPPESGLLSEDYTNFNDDQAAARRDWAVPAVLAEYRAATDRVMRLAARISSDRWSAVGTIEWYGPEYSLDDLIVYSMYGHKREHAPQLEAVLDRPGR